MRIAILENDTAAAQLLDEWLGAAGHALRYFASGNLFTRELDRQSFDVAIVGSTPADVRAAELTRTLRDRQTGVPLIRVLQKGSEQDIVAALNAGADDCMPTVRQFELLARVEALARRTKQPNIVTDEVLEFGNLSVDVRNRLILRDGLRVTLTPKTYNLALLLLSNCGQLLTRSFLLERIWGPNCSQSTRTLDTHISRLRTVLGLLPEHGWQLQSVYQHGYRLDQTETLVSPGSKRHGEILAQSCN
jgi:two-component system, OmpR family, response regulator RegX3